MAGGGTRRARRPRPGRVARRGIGPLTLPRGYLIAAATLPLILATLWGALVLVRVVAPPPAGIGDPAPTFALADLDGRPIRLTDLRGRPVIVNFWASWCAPCVEEFPLLQRALEAHAGDGLAIIGIVVDDDSESARAFMHQLSATWPAVMDPGGRLAQRYGIHGPPESFFVDREGTIVARQVGQLSAGGLEEKLAAIVAGPEE